MSVGTVIAYVVIIAALWAYFSYKKPDINEPKPEGVDSFRVTYNQEGVPLPLHWGVVRVPGNLLFYGNLDTDAIYDRVKSGWSSKKVIQGYEYEIDHWQAVCHGPAMIFEVYIDNRAWNLSTPVALGNYGWYATYYGAGQFWDPSYYYHYSSDDRTLYWSTGKCSGAILTSLQSRVGANANGMPGLAFAWHPKYLVGENTTYLQTLHYVVEKYSEANVNNANMSNGANPAAIIYDVIIMSGNVVTNIDTSSFNTAADYWNTKGYGLNLMVSQQTPGEDIIKKVLNYVDGCLYVDDDDNYVLKAYSENDTSVCTIETHQFKDFILERPTWNDVFSDFRAEYVNGDGAYEKRTLRVINSAVRNLVGYTRQMTVDLTAFRSKATASKRLWEIVKKHSYPSSNIQFTVGLEYLKQLNVGDVFTVSHDDYGIVSAKFRVTTKDFGKIDDNEIQFAAVQFIEGLFDDNYLDAADPEWTEPDRFSYPAEAFTFFELPFNPYYGSTPSWLILAQRANIESGFALYISTDGGTDYRFNEIFTSWSMRCNLDVQYLATTDEIDDDVGMILTADFNEDPEFSSISRSDLFLYQNIIVAGNEIMSFQNYEAYGATQIKLTGVVRGLWNTPIEQHDVNDKIWLTRIDDNVMSIPNASEVYLKVLPFVGGDVVPEDEVTGVQLTITGEYKAVDPWPVNNVRVVRDSSTQVTVTVYPSTQTSFGAGVLAGDIQYDETPPQIDSYIRYDVGATHDVIEAVSVRTFTGVSASQFNLDVYNVVNGIQSAYTRVVVGTTVGGEYWA